MKQQSLVQRLDTLRRDLKRKRGKGYGKPKKYTPWRVLALDYPSVPAGTLCAIAKGRIPHKLVILHALGLPITTTVEVCSIHGIAHKGKCPRHKNTFEENASAYEVWKQKHAVKLAGWVAWAEVSDAA